MKKDTKTLLILAAVAVAGYIAWRLYQNYKAQQPGGGQLGTNLNSIAPELVGGSQGPVAQPAFNVPVNITVTSSDTSGSKVTPPEQGANVMIPANASSSYGGSANALTQQNDAAAQDQSMMPSGDYAGMSPYAGQGGAG